MRVTILSKDSIFSRMLALEISAYGAQTKTEKAISDDTKKLIAASDFTVLDAEIFAKETEDIPELERTKVILFGYPHALELAENRIPAGFTVFSRPFAVQDFLSSIFEKNEEVLLRSAKRNKSPADSLILSEKNKTVSYKRETISLTRREFSLLTLLIKNRGMIVTREEAARAIWEKDFEKNTNIVDVYVRYLREKLDEKLGIKIISTVRGAGYTIKAE